MPPSDTATAPSTVVDMVLVVGEALIDVVERDGSSAEIVGGSPANVALTLGRLGRRVQLVTDIGDDERGRRIRDHLGKSDVLVSSGADGRTSTAVARIGADGAANYTFDIQWNPPRPRAPGAACARRIHRDVPDARCGHGRCDDGGLA